MTKKIFKGYSIASVIIILSIFTFLLISGMTGINFYINLSGSRIKNINQWDEFLIFFDKKLKDKFLDDKEEEVSPYDGWYKELPENLDGYKIYYSCEDSKIDINYIDFILFFNHNEKNPLSENKYFSKKIDNIVYSNEELKSYLKVKEDQTSDINIQDIFTIYSVPNINVSSTERIKTYLETNYMDNHVIDQCFFEIQNYRKNIDYLKFAGALGKKGGLIIDEFEFDNLKKFRWPNENSIHELFDYKGNINLNFVNEDVFEIAFKACIGVKADYKPYWDKINGFHSSNRTIKESDIKSIFGGLNLTIEKIFSVKSNIFKIDIIKDNKILTIYLRKYKNRNTYVKILKTAAGRYEKNSK